MLPACQIRVDVIWPQVNFMSSNFYVNYFKVFYITEIIRFYAYKIYFIQCLHHQILKYVTLDHKTSHKGQFFDIIWKLNK